MGLFLLEGPEAHHLARVRRVPVGADVTLFCGDGLDYPAVVTGTHRRGVELQVAAPIANPREWGHRLLAAVPLPKADRSSFLVEKLTELGITELQPLLTDRSVVTPRDGKTEKLRRTAIEACKQCQRSVVPLIREPCPLSEFLALPELPAARFVADFAGRPWSKPAPQDTAFLVGPEGGLTDEERTAAANAGFQPVRLGSRVLRVETAAIALATLCTVD